MKRYLAIGVFLIIMSAGVYAQVTFGSDILPVSGAILDLKEFDSPAGGTTAKKGLLLPRVAILDVNELQVAPDDQKMAHVGTIVYAVPEKLEEPEVNNDVCSAIPIVEEGVSGIMVWSGSEWRPLVAKEETAPEQSLPEWVHDAVKLSRPDHEGNVYTYRYFGNPDHEYVSLEQFMNAGGIESDYQNFGYWMTENLRSTKYAFDNPEGDLKLLPAGGGSTNDLVYAYPRKYNAGDARDDVDFKNYPNMGLLYSSGAIRHKAKATPNMQGICPDGWFLPTIADWDGLISFMQQPDQLAEFTSYAEGEPVYASATLATECLAFMNPQANNYTRSKESKKGALGLVAVGWARVGNGMIANSTVFEYPATPNDGEVDGMHFRAGTATSVATNIYKDFALHKELLIMQMVSVRCRTDRNPALHAK